MPELTPSERAEKLRRLAKIMCLNCYESDYKICLACERHLLINELLENRAKVSVPFKEKVKP